MKAIGADERNEALQMNTNAMTHGADNRRGDADADGAVPATWRSLVPPAICLGVGAIAALLAILT